MTRKNPQKSRSWKNITLQLRMLSQTREAVSCVLSRGKMLASVDIKVVMEAVDVGGFRACSC